jgi:hypothetical protein
VNPIKLLSYAQISAIEARAERAPRSTARQRQLADDLDCLIEQWHGLYTRISGAENWLKGIEPAGFGGPFDADIERRQVSGNGGGQRT